jgi:hypothetical protein
VGAGLNCTPLLAAGSVCWWDFHCTRGVRRNCAFRGARTGFASGCSGGCAAVCGRVSICGMWCGCVPAGWRGGQGGMGCVCTWCDEQGVLQAGVCCCCCSGAVVEGCCLCSSLTVCMCVYGFLSGSLLPAVSHVCAVLKCPQSQGNCHEKAGLEAPQVAMTHHFCLNKLHSPQPFHFKPHPLSQLHHSTRGPQASLWQH